MEHHYIWLVVDLPILKNDGVKVTWDVPNHQPETVWWTSKQKHSLKQLLNGFLMFFDAFKQWIFKKTTKNMRVASWCFSIQLAWSTFWSFFAEFHWGSKLPKFAWTERHVKSPDQSEKISIFSHHHPKVFRSHRPAFSKSPRASSIFSRSSS